MPILDDFQLTWLKYQDAKASAVKSGLAIEWGALMGMKMGGNELNPFDILSIYRTTGDLYYRIPRHIGASQANPISPLAGGMEGKTYEKKSKGTEKMKKFAELVETNAYKSSRY